MARYALLYPIRPGGGAAAEAVLREHGRPPVQAGGGTRLLSTTVFRKGDMIVRVFEIDGDLQQAVDHLVRTAVLHDVGRRLQDVMAADVDLSTEAGLRRFFTEHMMVAVTHRQADRPA